MRKYRICRFTFQNWQVDCGRVKNSLHEENTVYLKIVDKQTNDIEYNVTLTDYEAMVIVQTLSHAVFESLFRQRFPKAKILEY